MNLRLKTNCFSLIELLVVMAVIMILLTLLLPNVSSIFRKSQVLQCSNNLKQVREGYIQLTNEFSGGRLVPYRELRYGGVYRYWNTRIRADILHGEVDMGTMVGSQITQKENMEKGGHIFVCPHDKFYLNASIVSPITPGVHDAVWWFLNQQDADQYSSYGINTDIAHLWDLPPMLNQLLHPEKTIIMGDSGHGGISQYGLISRKVPNDTIALNKSSKWVSLFGISRHGLHAEYDLDLDSSKHHLIPEMEVNIAFLSGEIDNANIKKYKGSSSDEEKIRWWGYKKGGYEWWRK